MSPTNEILYGKFYLLLIIVTSLIGGLIYLGVASLYHFVYFFVAFVIVYGSGMEVKLPQNNPILQYMRIMLIEAAISILWAPDKALAGKYAYYVLLLFLLAFIFDNLINKRNLQYMDALMVFLLFALNLIGIWETVTNKHLLPDYLKGAGRARMLAYVPGGFFMNPNDFATYIIQILPFSLIASITEKSKLRLVAIVNIFLAAYVVFRTESRTQIILFLVLIAIYIAIAAKKGKSLMLISVIAIGSFVILKFNPSFTDWISQGLASISRDEIRKSSLGGSLGTRIALLKNGVMILIHTMGFGVGAGCHRVVMKQYGARYFHTGNVVVMHNLLGEIFVDYGLFVGIFFLVTLVRTVKILYRISKVDPENKIAASMFIATLCTFVVCGIASSSIIQLTSIWTTFCYIGAFVRVITDNNKRLYAFNF